MLDIPDKPVEPKQAAYLCLYLECVAFRSKQKVDISDLCPLTHFHVSFLYRSETPAQLGPHALLPEPPLARHYWNTSRRRLHLRHRPPLVLPVKTNLLLHFPLVVLGSARRSASTRCGQSWPNLPDAASSAGSRGQRLPLVRGLRRPSAAAPGPGSGSEGIPEDLHGYSHAHAFARGRESAPASAHSLPVLAAAALRCLHIQLLTWTCSCACRLAHNSLTQKAKEHKEKRKKTDARDHAHPDTEKQHGIMQFFLIFCCSSVYMLRANGLKSRHKQWRM